MDKTKINDISLIKNNPFIKKCLIISLIVIILSGICTLFTTKYLSETKVERLNKKFNLSEYLKNDSNDIIYALDNKSNLYKYTSFTNDKGYDDLKLTLEIENTGGIKQTCFEDGNLALITANNTLYIDKNYGLYPILEDVKSFKYNGNGVFLVLTNSGYLYGFGNNQHGEIGDGNRNGTGKSTQVDEPYLIMKNVKDYDSNHKNEYKSVALTNNGDLYIWGVYKLLFSEGMAFRNHYYVSSPTNILSNVKSFKSTEDNLIATTNNGEVILDEDDRLSNELDNKIYNSASESFRIMYGDMINSLGELSMIDFLNYPFLRGFKYYYNDKIEFDPFSNQPQSINFFNEQTNEQVSYAFDNYNGSIKLVSLGYSNGEGIVTATKKSPNDKIEYIVKKADGSSFEKKVRSVYAQIEVLLYMMHLFN